MAPDLDLTGRRVLVVGGETALGRALAVGLAGRGAAVAIATLTQATEAEFAVNSALNELWAMGREGVALVIDAGDAGELREATLLAERELGRLDLAAVVEGASPVATDAVRSALGERPVVVLAADGDVAEALGEIGEAL